MFLNMVMLPWLIALDWIKEIKGGEEQPSPPIN